MASGITEPAGGKGGIFLGVREARHDEKFVHVRRAGDDGLGAAMAFF
jgi:hypothetical protein